MTTSNNPADGPLLGPFDPVTLAGGVAANLATTILQHNAERLRATTFGRALMRLGLLKPGFTDRLQATLARAIDEYFEQHPGYLMSGVISFLTDPVTIKDLGDHILNGLPMDIEKLTKRLADDLDIPHNLHPSAWPCFNPYDLFHSLFSKLDACFGADADPGVLWIGRQLAGLRSDADAVQAQLGEFQRDLPSLFNTVLAEQQAEHWIDFEHQFLRHLQNRFGRLATPGARELHGVNQSLSIAYISLNVKAQGNAEPIRAERFLFETPLIVIRGPAGSGKTTLLNWITWCCAEGLTNPTPWRGGVPFFVPLRTIARTEVGAPRVNHFVQYSVDSELWSGSEPDGWIHDVLVNQKRAIVMIDGVDELPRSRRAEFWDWLAKFVDDYPENRVIVTSRTLPGSSAAHDSDNTPQWNPPSAFVDANLEEMSNADISSFIEHWHDAVDRDKLDEFEYPTLLRAKEQLPQKLEDPANRRIRELCSTPLLCALVCVLHWREEGYLPRQRVDLYNRCCDMLIEARDLKRGYSHPPALLHI